ncbi:hypothetical protein FRC04_003094 [Tulasnella sp. 424]|nr:hypothetical protein FRC04_003094 [Tulasnella sp. 424]
MPFTATSKAGTTLFAPDLQAESRDAKTAIAPLDRVKILFQASNPEFQKYSGSWTGMFRAARVIQKESGFRGLLQGHSATLLRVFPYAAIKFVAYDQLHNLLMPTRERETSLRRFVAGAGAGATSVLFTYPLELVRVRLAYQTRETTTDPSSSSSKPFRPSLRRAIQTIYREGDGLRALSTSPPPARLTTAQAAPQSFLFTHFPVLKFYRGFIVTLIGIIPYAGTSFLVYGSLRSLVYDRPPGAPKVKRSAPVDLSLGALAGLISQTVSYPFEIVRRRMQVGGLVRPGGWVGWRETVVDIWKTRGFRGFYVGLSIGYVKVVPMTAISYMVWEWSKGVLGV